MREAQAAHEHAAERAGRLTHDHQIELSDTTAQAAQAAGLLTPQALERLLQDAIERKQAAAGIPPMSMEEITAEVKTVRKGRRQRASSP